MNFRASQTLVSVGFALITLTLRAADGGPPPAKLETRFLRLTLSGVTGHCEIVDKETQVTWRPPPEQARFGEASLLDRSETHSIDLASCEVASSANELVAIFHPVPNDRTVILRVKVRALADQRTLEFTYEPDRELDVQSITLLEGLFGTTDKAGGYLLVPVREGLLIPADSGLEFTHRFDTYAYEGCHMEMLGAIQGASAAMLTWSDPYVAANVRSSLNTNEVFSEKQRLNASLTLRKSARTFQLKILGKGNYVTIAKDYRQIAQSRGWVVTWDQKLRANPDRARLLGAANIKLWSVLDRRMNADSTKEESVRVNWTFDEAAQVAEHFKNDLKLDKVLFTMGGWIHRGYDNQHPDILPTAPECGGDIAFSNCVRRVLNLGYLCCLHDNYQDIYRDSPSWSERYIMKTEDGKLARGGQWAGGQAFLICSQKALDLARRPQNLPGVAGLSHANAYFIDTTYAAGLQECFDPSHALTRADDMKWKQKLSDYAREVFGIFGSECGREWAIPHSDFFEGLTGVSGRSYHDEKLLSNLGATVVPLFDLVYRDCIAMYGKYGYDPHRAAEYVLEHISIALPLNYHSIPRHLYWKEQSGGEDRPAADRDSQNAGDPALFTRADNGWAAGRPLIDRFIKNTCEILCPLNEMTARMQMTQHEFLTPDRKVQHTLFVKGADHVDVVVNAGNTNFVWNSKLGGSVVLPPYGFVAESPTFVAFHALSWNGLEYDSAPLFTLRTLDKKPFTTSREIRVYHAFGNEQIRIGNATRSIWQ
ncbi:MAG: DUF6259 domain-containing protein, partial [Limisphaerales bacterium]